MGIYIVGVSEVIAFWNRREIYADFNMSRFNQILDLLAMEKIRYKYRTIGQASLGRGIGQASRGHYGTTGVNLDSSIMYYIYVHKKDAEIAEKLLRQTRK